MKKLVASLAVVAVMIAVPALAPAQGWPSLGVPDDVALGNLSLTGGYVTNAGVTHYKVSKAANGIGPAGVRQAEWDYDYASFYMAGTLPVSMGDRGALLLSASVAIPSTSQGRETLYNNAFAPVGSRLWSADTYTGTLEAIWAYPLSSSFSALAGFRWVYWQTSYKSPEIQVNPGIYTNTDTGDVTLNGYVPFIGLLATYGGLNVGAVGIPTTVGDLVHKESFANGGVSVEATGAFTGGYFFELFADYGMPMPGSLVAGYDADVALFGKCSFLAIDASPTLDWNVGAVTTTETMDFSLQRNLFVLGAKATLNFNIAGLLPF